MHYEDLSRDEIAHLILNDREAFYRLLTIDHWLLLLDGVAKTEKKPIPKQPEETWRRMLREQKEEPA